MCCMKHDDDDDEYVSVSAWICIRLVLIVDWVRETSSNHLCWDIAAVVHVVDFARWNGEVFGCRSGHSDDNTEENGAFAAFSDIALYKQP